MDLLKALSSEGSIEKLLGISHVDSPVLHVSEPDHALLLVKAANFYDTQPTEMATFHGLSFYSAARTVLEEFHEFNRHYSADMYQTLMSYTTLKLRFLSDKLQSVKHMFLMNMGLFQYDP